MAGCKGCRGKNTASVRLVNPIGLTKRIPAKQEDGFVTVYDSKGNPISLPI